MFRSPSYGKPEIPWNRLEPIAKWSKTAPAPLRKSDPRPVPELNETVKTCNRFHAQKQSVPRPKSNRFHSVPRPLSVPPGHSVSRRDTQRPWNRLLWVVEPIALGRGTDCSWGVEPNRSGHFLSPQRVLKSNWFHGPKAIGSIRSHDVFLRNER